MDLSRDGAARLPTAPFSCDEDPRPCSEHPPGPALRPGSRPGRARTAPRSGLGGTTNPGTRRRRQPARRRLIALERTSTRAVGKQAETLALQHLEKRGLRLVERNYRCRLGEIDLIMLDADCLVFVEVRYRSGKRLVPAVQTVDLFKQRKLGRAAEMYLARRQACSGRKARFDVVGIDRDPNGEIRFEWLRNAFSV